MEKTFAKSFAFMLKNGVRIIFFLLGVLLLAQTGTQRYDSDLLWYLTWSSYFALVVMCFWMAWVGERPEYIYSAIKRLYGVDLREDSLIKVAFEKEKRSRIQEVLVQNYIRFAIIGVIFTAINFFISVKIAEYTSLQANRLHEQNQLIRQQGQEDRKLQALEEYTLRLGPLLQEVAKARDADPEGWSRNPQLSALIQTTLRRLPVRKVDRDASILVRMFDADAPLPQFSPERGDLFLLLMSLGFDFSMSPLPLDFDGADLSGSTLYSPIRTSRNQSRILELGHTSLRAANLLDVTYAGVNAEEADFSGAFLDNHPTKNAGLIIWTPDLHDIEIREGRRVLPIFSPAGTNLNNAFIRENAFVSLKSHRMRDVANAFLDENGNIIKPAGSIELGSNPALVPRRSYLKDFLTNSEYHTAFLFELYKLKGENRQLGQTVNAFKLGRVGPTQIDNLFYKPVDGQLFKVTLHSEWFDPTQCTEIEQQALAWFRNYFFFAVHEQVPEMVHTLPFVYTSLNEAELECVFADINERKTFPEAFAHLRGRTFEDDLVGVLEDIPCMKFAPGIQVNNPNIKVCPPGEKVSQ